MMRYQWWREAVISRLAGACFKPPSGAVSQKGMVLSDWGKATHKGSRYVLRRRAKANRPMTHRSWKCCQNWGRTIPPGLEGAIPCQGGSFTSAPTIPAYGPFESRCKGGVSSVRASLPRMQREMTSRQGQPEKGGCENGNLSLGFRGFDSLPVKANHQPEASLA